MVWNTGDMPSQRGRATLVTGANSGLGFETSRALAAAGARVIMACRNEAKARQAMAKIRQEVPDAQLEFLALDLSDLESVRRAAAELLGRVPVLDLLINNAGVMAVPLAHTRAGFEMQMGTNHMGHFAFTGLVLPSLLQAKHARVVNVSSMAHLWTPGIDLSDLDWTRRHYRRWQAYGDSKLANLYFTFELMRRFSDQGLIVVAAHPGYSSTNLQYVAADLKQSPLERLIMRASNAVFGQSAAMGALPSLFAATALEVETGDFIGPDGFRNMRGYPMKVRARRRAYDETIAQTLWDLSVERTGVSFT